MLHHTLRILADVLINKPPGLPEVPADSLIVEKIINLVLNITGALCLLIVTLGGFKYVVSRGEPQEIAKAKDTIMYALIGVGIAILGRAIVAFVFNKVAP